MIFLTDGRAIGSFEVRGAGGTARAVLDPAVQGVRLARADDPALKPRSFGATAHGAPLLYRLTSGSGSAAARRGSARGS